MSTRPPDVDYAPSIADALNRAPALPPIAVEEIVEVCVLARLDMDERAMLERREARIRRELERAKTILADGVASRDEEELIRILRELDIEARVPRLTASEKDFLSGSVPEEDLLWVHMEPPRSVTTALVNLLVVMSSEVVAGRHDEANRFAEALRDCGELPPVARDRLIASFSTAVSAARFMLGFRAGAQG